MSGPRPEEAGETLGAIVGTITDTVANELRQLIKTPGGPKSLEADGLLSFVEINTGQDEIDKLQEKLNDTVMKLADDCAEEPAEGDRRYRLMVAYSPSIKIPVRRNPNDLAKLVLTLLDRGDGSEVVVEGAQVLPGHPRVGMPWHDGVGGAGRDRGEPHRFVCE